METKLLQDGGTASPPRFLRRFPPESCTLWWGDRVGRHSTKEHFFDDEVTYPLFGFPCRFPLIVGALRTRA